MANFDRNERQSYLQLLQLLQWKKSSIADLVVVSISRARELLVKTVGSHTEIEAKRLSDGQRYKNVC